MKIEILSHLVFPSVGLCTRVGEDDERLVLGDPNILLPNTVEIQIFQRDEELYGELCRQH